MIRRLTYDDAAEMAAIHKTCFPAGWPEDEMKVHISKDLCLGVGTPLKSFALIQIGGDQADILTIATAPEARRNRHAQNIIQAGEDALKNSKVRTLFLEVSEANIGAIALYKTLGFQPIGRRPAYYRTPHGRIAAITFSKNLA